MEEEVHEHYSSLAAGDEVEDNPEIGLACVLRFDGDGKFYRAEIIDRTADALEFVFADYGNIEEARQVLRIKPQFLILPKLVINF